MESYRILYRIKAVHDYFDGMPCTALQCRLTPQGAELARRRGLLFRQTAADEWTLLCQANPDTANDVLTLSLSITDPAFTLYTMWDGLRPSADNALELPQQKEELDAATAIHLSGKRRSIGSSFCTVSLRLTEQMAQASETGQPMQTTLRFHAPEMRWEYLLVFREDGKRPEGRLLLEDTTGKVTFSSFEESEAYGRKALRTVSEGAIPMRRTYGCKLRLTAHEDGRQRRVLLPEVSPPEPGRFHDTERGMLRQVCYY